MCLHNMYVLGRFNKNLDAQFGTVEKADHEKAPYVHRLHDFHHADMRYRAVFDHKIL